MPIVHHGGSLFGYKSDWMILPDSGVGAVLLTNADNGGMLLGPLMRRLVEVVFDGKPEAVGDVTSAASIHRAFQAKERTRLQIPAAKDEVAKVADRYSNPALGDIRIDRGGAATTFRFNGWEAPVATRKNDDGTTSFVTLDPVFEGEEFVVAEREGKRALVVRDGQHEYVFTEIAPTTQSLNTSLSPTP